MVYTKQTWTDGPSGSTPISAARLGHMEDGIAEAVLGIRTLQASGGDDTAALNAAFAQGGRWALVGSFSTTDTVYIAASTPTSVDGRAATLTPAGNFPALRIQNAAHALVGLTVSGAGLTAGNSGLVISSTAPDSLVQGCTFRNVAGSAVVVDTAHRTRLLHNTFDTCGRNATSPFNNTVYVTAADYVLSIGNIILNCDWGIYYRGTATATPIRGGRIIGNYINGANVAISQGISAAYPANQIVEGNTIRGFADNAIDHMGGVNCGINNNTISASKDGVFVGHQNTYGMTVANNAIDGCQRGVRVWDGATHVVVSGNSISAPQSGDVSFGGIQVKGDTAGGDARVGRITILGNSIRAAGSGTYGIEVVNADVVNIADNRTWRTPQQGIRLFGVDVGDVRNNQVQDASFVTVNTYAGITTDSTCLRIRVDDNLVYGAAKEAVIIGGGTGNRVRGNRWRSVTPGGVTDTGTATVLSDNVAY